MTNRPRVRSIAGRVALGLLACFCAFAAVVLVEGWIAFGHGAEGDRLARMRRSPQWSDDHFENPQPLENDLVGMFSGMFHASPHGSPTRPLAVARIDRARFARVPASGLRVTWLGHSSTLVEIDGIRVLTDPVWSTRPSPIPWLGPERWYPPPIALADLPRIDAVVISHDHYDHLDHATIRAMRRWDTTFVVPLGVGAHLEYWGVPIGRIVELDWWESTRVGDVTIHCTPARHASGRTLWDKDETLWASYSLVGPVHRVYFSGDTGLFPAMREIGRRLGPFDLTMIEVGQYDAAWPDWHIGPEQAVFADTALRGRTMLPIHWALFALAYHGWTEPIERVAVESRALSVPTITPRPGESVEPTLSLETDRWWPVVPWRSARAAPVVSHHGR